MCSLPRCLYNGDSSDKKQLKLMTDDASLKNIVCEFGPASSAVTNMSCLFYLDDL